MVHFKTIDVQTFLNDYWQKKPLVIRRALPNFINPLSPDELAGLALEEEIESRIVLETPGVAPYWHLRPGPFAETDFSTLPKTHWTLLVQGVDRFVPEVMDLLDHFNFIPQWRVDDVMISYAVSQGSVGPHYDHYDVFLYQASGRRKWSLTTQHCRPENHLTNVALRIMDTFHTEEEYILEPGDMLYLPPQVGHHGVSLSDDCMTYSFGYRSYQGQELWDTFGDYMSEYVKHTGMYCDPTWNASQATAEIPPKAWQQAKALMLNLLADEAHLKTWFGCFATRLDQHAEAHMPAPLEDDELCALPEFIEALINSPGLVRDATCRMAYQEDGLQLFINGCVWESAGVDNALVKWVANNRSLPIYALRPYLAKTENQQFLFALWTLQWLDFLAAS